MTIRISPCIALFLGACSATTPSESPAPRVSESHAPPLPSISSVAPSPSIAPTASASASAAVDDPPELCELLEADVAPLFKPLFDRATVNKYVMTDAVDPHSEDGGRIKRRVMVECRVAHLVKYPTAVGSVVTCTPDDVLPTNELSFLATTTALYMNDGVLPIDAADLASTTSEPPFLLAKPASTKRSHEDCTTSITVGDLVCHDERCSQGMYGPTQDQRCFSSARGFESWKTSNLLGPRDTVWKLQSTTRLKGSVAPALADIMPICPP